MMQTRPSKPPVHRYKGCLTLTDAYNLWKEKCREHPSLYVSSKEYKKICHNVNKAIIKHLVEEAGEIDLPFRFGTMKVKKRKTNLKTLRFDYGTYRKTGLKVKHLNEHSNGFYCRFYWYKGIIHNISAYSFLPCKQNKRDLAAAIKNKGVDFFE